MEGKKDGNETNMYFYSRPCGRGDRCSRRARTAAGTFLLTPLREGRPEMGGAETMVKNFYSRPCGRGDRPCPEKQRDIC